MASGEQLGDIPQVNSGVLLDSVGREYAWGERASEIRRLRLKYPELNQEQIAEMVGCSHQNVSEVLAEFLADTSQVRLGEFRADKAEICESIQHKFLRSITQEKLDKTPAVSLVTGFAILEDKIRLMRGQPTSVHVNVLVNVLEELRAKRESERR